MLQCGVCRSLVSGSVPSPAQRRVLFFSPLPPLSSTIRTSLTPAHDVRYKKLQEVWIAGTGYENGFALAIWEMYDTANSCTLNKEVP